LAFGVAQQKYSPPSTIGWVAFAILVPTVEQAAGIMHWDEKDEQLQLIAAHYRVTQRRIKQIEARGYQNRPPQKTSNSVTWKLAALAVLILTIAYYAWTLFRRA
jgi:hypothetical protein